MVGVLDTNHFRVVAEGTDAAARIDQHARDGHVEICLSIITVQEAAAGWLGLINGKKAGRDQIRAYASFQRTIIFCHKFRILAFTEDAAEHFHRLRADLPRAGTMDLKIASICLANDATLLTRNLVDFERIPGLRVDNWLD